MPNRIERRSVLATVSSGTAVLGGCSRLLGGSSGHQRRLFASFVIRNLDPSAAHTVAVTTTRNGTVVLEETYRVGPWNDEQEGNTADPHEVLDPLSGTIVVEASVDGRTDSLESNVSAIAEGRCYGFELRVTREGRLSTLVSHEVPCSDLGVTTSAAGTGG